MIIIDSLNYAQKKPDYKVRIDGQQIQYGPNSMFHRNIVMSEALQAIENVILFSISTYFLKFSEAYKRIHNIRGEMHNDWYEFVEYGTINKLTIFHQRNEFSRETAMYIRQHRDEYVEGLGAGIPKLKRSLLNCGNFSVVLEVQDMSINNPDLFVD